MKGRQERHSAKRNYRAFAAKGVHADAVGVALNRWDRNLRHSRQCTVDEAFEIAWRGNADPVQQIQIAMAG